MSYGKRLTEEADLAVRALAPRGLGNPRAAVVLGSGLAGAVQIPSPSLSVGFDEIPGFPRTSVSGHPGRMIAGMLSGLELLVVEGRFHLYEEQGAWRVGLMTSFLKAAGVRQLILTTAAGALAPHIRVGEIVVVRDQLVYPLGSRAVALGMLPKSSGLGPRGAERRHPAALPESQGDGRLPPGAQAEPPGDLRRPPVTPEHPRGDRRRPSRVRRGPFERAGQGTGGEAAAAVYSPSVAARLEMACLETGLRFQRGVLAFAAGPCYETAAEARLLRWGGADVVSMSAAADAIAARSQGLELGCVCCVTNSIGLWRSRGTDHDSVLGASGFARAGIGKVIEKYSSLTAIG